MAIDLISRTRTVLFESGVISDLTNDSASAQDIGGANNGLLIITLNAVKSEGTDAADNVGLYTYESDVWTEADANRVMLRQNTSDSQNSCTVGSTGEITAGLSSDGIYVFEAENLKRYVNIEFDGVSSDGTSRWTVLLITTNLDEAIHKSSTATD